eukprot:759497-Hanusia_phi.AAC.3
MDKLTSPCTLNSFRDHRIPTCSLDKARSLLMPDSMQLSLIAFFNLDMLASVCSRHQAVALQSEVLEHLLRTDERLLRPRPRFISFFITSMQTPVYCHWLGPTPPLTPFPSSFSSILLLAVMLRSSLSPSQWRPFSAVLLALLRCSPGLSQGLPGLFTLDPDLQSSSHDRL